MAKAVPLNSVEHKDLRVITERAEEYGDNVWYALTFPLEFRSLQAHYPIFFQKHPETGRFFALALLGFREGENLFLEHGKWQASYVPLSIRRQPFLIGRQTVTEDGVEKQQRVIHIDMENPRVNTERGERLFMEFGGNSPYLDNIGDMLEAIHQGLNAAEGFIDALVEHELLEPFTLEVQLDSGDKNQLVGFYTINEDKLRDLGTDALTSLHKAGYLEPIYMAMASQSNVRQLLEAKNRRVAEA
ncbi:SapC family protein [Microbulbifer sp. YPW16]|uniref:SapC family protein n=1 Tax=Microbulbifer sp. YPW16 TaxID=2904242 RepID=UPI001E29744A|nr:SapC family protein [Microbulbifer sp. YPW16]UHQ53752.1 SapC family protein [Microbulbifer sp. YPW16]